MRERLIAYVDLLFAGNPEADDIKQEILQNTLDKYDDLVANGKTPEAAYSQAISGIGDLSGILGAKVPPAAPAGAAGEAIQKEGKKSGRYVAAGIGIALAAGLLILALAFWLRPVPQIIGNEIMEEMDLDTDDDLDSANYSGKTTDKKETAGIHGEVITVDASVIDEIQVDWVAGDVQLLPGEVTEIEIQETVSDKPLVYSMKEGKLRIQFCEEIIGVKFGKNLRMPDKDLTITVPADWVGEELEIHSVSADVEVRDLSLEELEFQGVSGKFDLQNCKIGELSMETVSGKVTMNGQVREVECESVSANCELVLTNVPREISMEGVSGSLELTLPAEAGFTVKMDGLSKNLDTDFAVTKKDGRFVAGDGSCKIEIEGISGNAKIHQAK